jgi:hypothetical protein
MNAARLSRAKTPPGWAEMLDSIQLFLERNITDLDARQCELAKLVSWTSADSANSAERAHRWDDGRGASLEKVEKLAADADAHLRGVQDILGAWLAEAEELRAKLAKWEAGSV